MNQGTRDDYEKMESRLQTLEQRLSTQQRELKEITEMVEKIRSCLNAVVDFINLDSELEHPGSGSDLPHV
jgi:hypothetical protein